MRDIKITDKEYDKLVKRVEFFDVTRNNLLTFSFTAVLTVLGVALAIDDMNSLSSWICLIPFFLIIPFSARISYYRLASAHIISFLKFFIQSDMQFEIATHCVRESKCKHYDLIAWLVNHEMFLLGVASSCTFYLKYISSIEKLCFFDYISMIVPILLILIVYVISDSVFHLDKLMDDFANDWNRYNDQY